MGANFIPGYFAGIAGCILLSTETPLLISI
jgi:hypothetical protein